MMASATVYETAHKYGLDDYFVLTPDGISAILGTSVSVDRAEFKSPAQTVGTRTEVFSNGFKITENYVAISNDMATVQGQVVQRVATGETLVLWSGPMAVQWNLNGADLVPARIFDDLNGFTGNSFNNTFRGYVGNDTLIGGGGTDTAVFSGKLAQYAIKVGAASTVVSGPDGVDTLTSMERLRFDDVTVAYDTAGAAGQAYRLYQAAFNRTPDQGGLGYQTKALDNGQVLAQVAANFIASPEFQRTYGALDNTGFVTQLYANVLHRAPDSGGLAFHVGNLNGGMARADVLAGFSESPENQATLIGTISAGMVYTG